MIVYWWMASSMPSPAQNVSIWAAGHSRSKIIPHTIFTGIQQTGLSKQGRSWSDATARCLFRVCPVCHSSSCFRTHEHVVKWDSSHSRTSMVSILSARVLRENNLIVYITKSYLYNLDPLKPHFIYSKTGVYRVYIIFLISAKNTEAVLTST